MAALTDREPGWLQWVVGGAVVGVGIGMFLAQRGEPESAVEDGGEHEGEAEVIGQWEKEPNKRTQMDTKGPALYTKAKALISGGVGLLSKRPELFLPDL